MDRLTFLCVSLTLITACTATGGSDSISPGATSTVLGAAAMVAPLESTTPTGSSGYPVITEGNVSPQPQPVAKQPVATRTQSTVPVSSPRTVDPVTSVERPPEGDQKLSAEQQLLVDWAQTRFGEAGLELPDVDFLFHADMVTCHGHVGLFYLTSRSLHMCCLDKHSILHELAHAWAHHNLSDQQRAAFTTLRGLEGWNDDSLDWAERGAEHAAEIIAWALMDRNVLVQWVTTIDNGTSQRTWRLLTIDDSGPDQLIEAYEFLTRSSPAARVSDDPRVTPRTETMCPEARRYIDSTPAHSSSTSWPIRRP